MRPKGCRRRAISLCWDVPFRTALEAGGYRAGNSPATNPFGLPLGAVIPIIELIDVYYITLENRPVEPEYSFGDYTPGRFAWVLRDVCRLPNPGPRRAGLVCGNGLLSLYLLTLVFRATY